MKQNLIWAYWKINKKSDECLTPERRQISPDKLVSLLEKTPGSKVMILLRVLNRLMHCVRRAMPCHQPLNSISFTRSDNISIEDILRTESASGQAILEQTALLLSYKEILVLTTKKEECYNAYNMCGHGLHTMNTACW